MGCIHQYLGLATPLFFVYSSYIQNIFFTRLVFCFSGLHFILQRELEREGRKEEGGGREGGRRKEEGEREREKGERGRERERERGGRGREGENAEFLREKRRETF